MRWHRLLDPLVSDEERAVLHTRYPAIRFAFVEMARRAEADAREDDRLFTSHLTDLVAASPDATLSELREQLKKKGRLEASIATIWRGLEALGLSRKKRPGATTKPTPGNDGEI